MPTLSKINEQMYRVLRMRTPTIDPNVLEYTIYFALHAGILWSAGEVTELVNKRPK